MLPDPFVIAMADVQPEADAVPAVRDDLAIFYFLILMPMKRRREGAGVSGVAESGDKVVTTSGIHGEITRITDNVVRLQIADRVRINISRAAIGGYQGRIGRDGIGSTARP
jgi:preprotein translocase YajC subunit